MVDHSVVTYQEGNDSTRSSQLTNLVVYTHNMLNILIEHRYV